MFKYVVDKFSAQNVQKQKYYKTKLEYCLKNDIYSLSPSVSPILNSPIISFKKKIKLINY